MPPAANPQRTPVQRELDEMIAECAKSKNLGRPRRYVAYSLKFVAGLSALAVALGKWVQVDQFLGIASALCVLLDAVSSNHLRLIGETKAGHAYARVFSTLVRDHNREMTPLLEELRRQPADPEPIQKQISELESRTHKQLSETIRTIKDALAELDIKALERVALDADR